MHKELRFTLNGSEVAAPTPHETILVDLLRNDFGLTGTKASCRVGVCGACSVLLDDEVVSACLVPAFMVESCDVWTIEGLSDEDPLMAELQEEFVHSGAFQCGYCTPGQLVTAYALLGESDRQPSLDAVTKWMEGNLCRCTGYAAIDEAIVAVSERRGRGAVPDTP